MLHPDFPAPSHRRLGDHKWQDRAACLGAADEDPDLFFPSPDDDDRADEAKRFCARCPVRDACLDAALVAGDRHGIRGGLTAEEREALHLNLDYRLDYTRVEAALKGRDIHLTRAERRAVVRLAHHRGVGVERLARILKVTEDRAERLLRAAAREDRRRQRTATSLPLPAGEALPAPGELGEAA
ncbi:WhiB family transcriptional regulator [Streptomyces carpaticus]|uniref:WhiB family transcriptional regulator n=1 Tax=Streptomyces carpaticus TaxID=285558 RepID=UPI0031F9C4D8